MIIGINSIINKFGQLKETVLVNREIFVVNERKLDEIFLESLFLVDGFSKPYRLDKNKNRGETWFSYARQFQVEF